MSDKVRCALAIVALAVVCGCVPPDNNAAPVPSTGAALRARRLRHEAESRARCGYFGEWSDADSTCVVDLDDERNRHPIIVRYTMDGRRVDSRVTPPTGQEPKP